MPDFNLNQLLPPLPEQTDVVTFQVRINGNPIPDNFEVTHLTVNRCFNRIPYAILRILGSDVSHQDREVSDQDLFSPGNPIEIAVGYRSDNEDIFHGIIIRHALKIGQGNSPIIEVECKDSAVKLCVARKNKYYTDSKDSEIIEGILRENGIGDQVEDTGVQHAEMVQYYATDWDFILTRAEANAKLVLAKDNELIIKKPEFDGDAAFVLNYGTSIYEFEAEMDARDQYPAVKASAWDFSRQELTEVEANANGVSPSGGGLLGGLGSAVSAGAGALQSAAGAVGISLPGVPPNTDYTQVLGVEHLTLQHSGNLTQRELENWASAQYQKSQLAKIRGRVKFEGVVQIYPGDRIELQNVGLRHNGKVFITGVRHEIGDGSWYTHAQFGLPQDWFVKDFPDVNGFPAGALLPAINGLQIGVVTRLAGDPDSQDRIKVRLPVLSAQDEGIWTRVAAQDAGNNRGAFFRPEIGDEVIVGFINDDPRQAIVLGMLNSNDKPAPLSTTDENHEKGWTTRSEIKMLFNDDKKSLLVETPGGNKLTIDDSDQSIKLEDQHGNTLTMNKDGIEIHSASNLKLSATGDIELEGTNISNTASAEFKADGSASTKVSSSGSLTVQGSIVQIN